MKTAVVLSDTHVGFHDEKALAVVYQITEAIQPDAVVHLGDLLDCYKISRFLKHPDRLETLQSEIDGAREVLERLSVASPKATRVLLEGNHERRLHKAICNLDGPSRELAQLSSVRNALEWPSLLATRALGWRWVPEEAQPLGDILPALLQHGTVVRRHAAFSAKAEFERLHTSGFSGHTHRQGLYRATHHTASHLWAEVGCTCIVDKYDYGIGRPNWQQGFAVVSWHGNTLGVELVGIRNGVAAFRGTRWKGR